MSLTTYFESIGYKHTYDIGDRVIGEYHRIPFVGSVGNDRLVSTERGPEVTIHLDLPLLFEEKYYTIIIVKHKDIRRLHEISTKYNIGESVRDSTETARRVRRKTT